MSVVVVAEWAAKRCFTYLSGIQNLVVVAASSGRVMKALPKAQYFQNLMFFGIPFLENQKRNRRLETFQITGSSEAAFHFAYPGARHLNSRI